MKKSRLLGAVCACALLFVLTSSKAATLLGSSNPGNVVDLGSVGGFTDIEVRFTDLATIWMEFENVGFLYDTFFISIINDTGNPWSGFHFEFIDANITQPLHLRGITGQLVDEQIMLRDAWYSFDPPETAGLHGTDGLNFTFATYFAVLITPSAVPIPAAVWLFGSGLLGLVGMARRKKA